MELNSSTPHLYDNDHVRYTLYQTNGLQNYNWLFLPGGPGADSSYFKGLVDGLKLPGNVWLLDLPGVGSNSLEEDQYDFQVWIDIFPSVVGQFENPIIVGHSFGGMFPLLFPEMEKLLKGFVILNSTPSLWMEEAVLYGKQFDLPDLTLEMTAFTQDPNQKTFEVALDACMPYYFPKNTLEEGRAALSQVPFTFKPAVWWQQKAVELDFTAQWIPEEVPVMIIGGKYDCICPFTLFQKDKRFHRKNISLELIEEGGHLPWVEEPVKVRELFDGFIETLLTSPLSATEAIYD